MKPVPRLAPFIILALAVVAGAFFLWFQLRLPVPGPAANLVFAEGRIQCEIVPVPGEVPERVLATLPIAMNAALEHVGPPSTRARLTVTLLGPPGALERLRARLFDTAKAEQEGDDIRLRPEEDSLKLAFRLGHEIAHWLTSKRHPLRPPLWLDEGLAQLVGRAAANVAARTHKQDLSRPLPPRLAENLFSLDELTTLADYPKTAARSAAFYWQAEALVAALRKKLGPAEFTAYLGLVAHPDASDWHVLLRTRWYFSDWDFDWLAEQIRPEAEPEYPLSNTQQPIAKGIPQTENREELSDSISRVHSRK